MLHVREVVASLKKSPPGKVVSFRHHADIQVATGSIALILVASACANCGNVSTWHLLSGMKRLLPAWRHYLAPCRQAGIAIGPERSYRRADYFRTGLLIPMSLCKRRGSSRYCGFCLARFKRAAASRSNFCWFTTLTNQIAGRIFSYNHLSAISATSPVPLMGAAISASWRFPAPYSRHGRRGAVHAIYSWNSYDGADWQ